MLDYVSMRQVSPVFVGRGPELSKLRSLLASASAGEPAVVVVGGDAGIGKSRLIEEFVRPLLDPDLVGPVGDDIRQSR